MPDLRCNHNLIDNILLGSIEKGLMNMPTNRASLHYLTQSLLFKVKKDKTAVLPEIMYYMYIMRKPRVSMTLQMRLI